MRASASLSPSSTCAEDERCRRAAQVAEAAQSNILDRNGGTFYAQGSPPNTNNVSVDGIQSTDVDNGGSLKMQMSADSIAEVTVLQNNYQAEYAGRSGAVGEAAV